MANYTNQIPANLSVGDIILLNRNGNYVLSRGQYKAEVASAAGGRGGYAMAYSSLQGYDLSGTLMWRILNNHIRPGGTGGAGLVALFDLAVGDEQNAITVAAGAAGAGGGEAGIDWLNSGTAYGPAGKTGADTSLTLNGTRIALVKGGTGGTGGSVTAPSGGHYPKYVGETVNRSVSGTNGTNGADGKIELAPTGYTTNVNTGNGYIKLTVISLNSPPSKPEPITYGTPLAGRELVLNCAVSTDPDPGDTIQYEWSYRADSGAWVQIAITDTNSATVTVPSSGNNITFRVRAVDNHGAESGYATGSPKVIIYNYPPTISGVDEDRGEIHDPFSYAYTVDDPDAADILTVMVYLDSPIRQLDKIENAVRNQQYDVDLTDLWEFVSMGKHALIIHAKDDKGGEAFRRISFTRYSNKLEVELAEPIKLAELITTLIPMINYAAGNDYTFTCRVKNDPAAAWEDVSAFNHLGQIYEFVNDQKTTAGDSEFYCQVDIEKGPSKHPIEFRGGTFVVNANGIEVSYLKGAKIPPHELPAGGYLGADVVNGQMAVNQLSLAVADLIAGGGGSADKGGIQSMLPVMKSSWAGQQGESFVVPDPAVWATDRICTVASESPANQMALPILAHPEHKADDNAPVKYIFLPAGWEEPKAHDTGESVMAPIEGIFEVAVAQGAPVGTVVYAERSWADPNNDALLDENYGQLTLVNTGWQVGVVVAPGLMKLTVNEKQSGGDTVEYGSNANGYYAKFASGLLICWRKQFTFAAASTAYNWSYPHIFASTGGVPVIAITSSTNTNASVLKAAASNYNYAQLMSNVASSAADLIAMGHWK